MRKEPIVEIKEEDFGLSYQFTIEDIDLSNAAGYTCRLYVFKDTTIYLTSATLACTLVGTDTVCVYTVAEDDFDFDPGTYFAELQWTKAGYQKACKTFVWNVRESPLP